MRIAFIAAIYVQNEKHWAMLEQTMRSVQCHRHELLKIAIINHCEGQYRMPLSRHFDFIADNASNCLAQAWNLGLRIAFVEQECDYAIISNLDVDYKKTTIDELVAFANVNSEAVAWSCWSEGETPSVKGIGPDLDRLGRARLTHLNTYGCFSVFMLAPRTIEKLKDVEQGTKEPFPGYFDERIRPAYGEDNDFSYRLDLAGLTHFVDRKTSIVHHRRSTIRLHDDPKWATEHLSNFNQMFGSRCTMPGKGNKSLAYLTRKWGGVGPKMRYTKPFEKG